MSEVAMVGVGVDGVGDWRSAHERLVGLARARAGHDLEEGRWLVAALRSGAHRQLGYGSFGEYIERLFGYSPRLTHDKLRVAEALEELPAMTRALDAGETSWSALRELTRVATRETEGQWLAAAQRKTVREVEKLVSGHAPGDLPSDPPDWRRERHVLRFEVSGEALATFRDAMAKIRRDAGAPLDDDAALLLMARHVLQGPSDEGRASYQVALTLCESCQRGWQQGHGEQVEVSAAVVATATCDAQHLGRSNGRGVSRAKQTVPPALRRAVLRRDGGRCVVPGCRHATFVDVHHVDARADGGGHHAHNLIVLCSAHHHAVHRGDLSIRGSAPSGLRFQHADGTAYGNTAVSPDAALAHARAFRALRQLGFGEAEARQALATAETHVGKTAPFERLLRRCLRELTSRALARAS